jgi:hypothetical protein
MQRVEDMHRSLKRLLSLAFPEPWVIRLEMAQYSDEQRPLIVVEPVGDLARTGVQPTIPSRPHVLAQTFVITAYPALMDDPREARQQAEMVLDMLDRLVNIGWVENDVSVSGPLRLPMWNYAGVPVTGAGRGNPDGLVEWDQVAWVDTWSGLTIPDPQDDRRFTVPYTVRMSWQADSRYIPAPLTTAFGGVFVADPAEKPDETFVPPGPVPEPLVPVAQGPQGPPGPPGPMGPQGKWVQMTQEQYDALEQKDPDTLYVIVG